MFWKNKLLHKYSTIYNNILHNNYTNISAIYIYMSKFYKNSTIIFRFSIFFCFQFYAANHICCWKFRIILHEFYNQQNCECLFTHRSPGTFQPCSWFRGWVGSCSPGTAGYKCWEQTATCSVHHIRTASPTDCPGSSALVPSDLLVHQQKHHINKNIHTPVFIL